MSPYALQISFLLVFIGLAVTSILAVIVRALQEWQVREEWPMLTFLVMNIFQAIVFILLVFSNAVHPIIARETILPYILFAWIGVFIF